MNDQVFLINQDPRRIYKLANPNDFHTGAPDMLRRGWRIEVVTKDGPRVIGGEVVSDGSELRMNGDVWMSMPLERWAEIYAEGQAVADTRSRIIGQKGGPDGIIGPLGRPSYAHENVETTERVRG